MRGPQALRSIWRVRATTFTIRFDCSGRAGGLFQVADVSYAESAGCHVYVHGVEHRAERLAAPDGTALLDGIAPLDGIAILDGKVILDGILLREIPASSSIPSGFAVPSGRAIPSRIIFPSRPLW